VFGTKKEKEPNSPARFFLHIAASSSKVDALKTLHYYDKKKFSVLQGHSYKKNILSTFSGLYAVLFMEK